MQMERRPKRHYYLCPWEHFLQLFQVHFNPRKNPNFKCYRIHRWYQETLNASDYVTKIKGLANNCEFGDLRVSLARDQLVFGINNNDVRKHILQKGELTLENAV